MITQRLELATRARHAAIATRSMLLRPDLSRAAYCACLHRLFGYHAPLEMRLLRSRGWHPVGREFGDPHKTSRLSQDLVALGVAPEELDQTVLCCALPDVRTEARLLGCLYAIEGATPGDPLVVQHLQTQLGITPHRGTAFFSAHAEHTGSRWKKLGLHLSAFAKASGSAEEIVAGAKDTFDTLNRWLQPLAQHVRAGDAGAENRAL